MNLRYTLLADGSSDRSLIPIIDWSLKQTVLDLEIETIVPQWADLGFLYKHPTSLSERIRRAVEAYPCDLLFIHRDAELEPAQTRISEIQAAVSSAQLATPLQCIPVIPVRMTEAWLLSSEVAIRRAAANPSGVVDLKLPKIAMLEKQADPKELLFEKLRLASGLGSRRRERFRVEEARTLISQFIDDFSHLQNLKSFKAFQDHLKSGLDLLVKANEKQVTLGKGSR